MRTIKKISTMIVFTICAVLIFSYTAFAYVDLGQDEYISITTSNGYGSFTDNRTEKKYPNVTVGHPMITINHTSSGISGYYNNYSSTGKMIVQTFYKKRDVSSDMQEITDWCRNTPMNSQMMTGFIDFPSNERNNLYIVNKYFTDATNTEYCYSLYWVEWLDYVVNNNIRTNYPFCTARVCRYYRIGNITNDTVFAYQD